MFCAFSGPGSTSTSLMYHYSNGKEVYSPNAEEPKTDSASYSSFKLPSTSFTGHFFDGTNSSVDPWSSASGISPSGHGGMLGSSSSSQSLSGNNGNLPAHDRLNITPNSAPPDVSKCLPPMSSFHRGSSSASSFVSSPHNTHAGFADRRMGGQGSTAGGSHTGETLRKALASIYSPDHTNGNFPSSSSTPGRSSPMAASTVSAGANQWPRSGGQTILPSNYENSMQTLVEDKLDRLEDVIHVLRNHAVGGTNFNLLNDMRNLIGLTQQGQITMRSNCPITGLVTNGLPTDVSAADPGEAAHLGTHSSTSSSSSDLTYQEDYFRGSHKTSLLSSVSSGNLEVKTEPSDVEDFRLHRTHSRNPSHPHHSSRLSHSSSSGLHSDEESDIREPETPSNDSATRTSSIFEDEELSPEQKAERERGRRLANNARERLRVRDINEAFKELGRMCQLHLKSDKPQTKLLILHQAVAVILSLEQQVRERNLNPKTACLRRREEEKVSAMTLDPQSMHTVIHATQADQVTGHL
ncbi:transcription factor 12-like isoform X3 [Silurus meridionalis]|uniref:transcription factor 12-like isoform X3 n=1 Tax=Silurus meridionalis TaxID=175797 RepID=UPI001EEC65B8|nr:transcription factor 12-like isoform X3 [Silurus meridionalis]